MIKNINIKIYRFNSNCKNKFLKLCLNPVFTDWIKDLREMRMF